VPHVGQDDRHPALVLEAEGDRRVAVVGQQDHLRLEGSAPVSPLELDASPDREGRLARRPVDGAVGHDVLGAVQEGMLPLGQGARAARVVEVAVGNEHVVQGARRDARGLQALGEGPHP
jgi:hypothetical protein